VSRWPKVLLLPLVDLASNDGGGGIGFGFGAAGAMVCRQLEDVMRRGRDGATPLSTRMSIRKSKRR
jgi:hypothetical protein